MTRYRSIYCAFCRRITDWMVAFDGTPLRCCSCRREP